MTKLKENIKSYKLLFKKTEVINKKIVELYPILFFILYLLGVFAGSLFSSSSKEIVTCMNFLISENETTSHFLTVFKNNLWKIAIYELLAFIFGFCGIGQPIIFAIPFMSGVGYGVSQIYLLANSIKAADYLIFCVNGILDILITIILIFCCKQSIKMANYLFKSGISSQKNGEIRTKNISVNSYLSKYFVYTIILFILVLIKTAAELFL